jgi:hypothetical protein
MPTTPGAYRRSIASSVGGDSYLAIVTAQGNGLEAATFFGGTDMERTPYGIAVATNGDIVFASGTASTDIPTSSSSYRRNLSGSGSEPDGYVCRISPDLRSLRWCTYTGGGWPRGGIVLDGSDNVIVTGNTTGSPFPTTAGVVQSGLRGVNDAFVLKLTADGRQAIWSTLLGGSGQTNVEVGVSARLMPNGDLSIVGISQSTDFPVTTGAALGTSLGPPDAFAVRLGPTASSLVSATLFGGSAADPAEHRHAILPDGSVLFAGVTASTDLPSAMNASGGSLDGYLVQLSRDGRSFTRVRYLGGAGREQVLGPFLDSNGLIYLWGATDSPDFPVTPDAIQKTLTGGNDGFLTILNPDFSIRYSTLFGGSGDELVRGVTVDTNGDVFLIGGTTSQDFPTTTGAFQTTNRGKADGFVVKLFKSP